jgi:hypothetical protein
LQTQLLNIAQGAWLIIVMIGSAQACQKSGQSCLMMIVSQSMRIVQDLISLLAALESSCYCRHRRNPRRKAQC